MKSLQKIGADFFIAIMFVVVVGVVAAMSYDFGVHNTRYQIYQQCATEGEAHLRFAEIVCTVMRAGMR